MVAILEKMASFVGTTGSEVDSEHGLDVDLLAPFHEFVRAKLIAFGGKPSQVKSRRAFIARADAVFPVVTGHEVAARIADDRWAQFPGQIHHVLTKTIFVSRGMSRFKNTGIDAAAHMFDKAAKQATVQFRNREVVIDDEIGRAHV